jgi:hypothetical protein
VAHRTGRPLPTIAWAFLVTALPAEPLVHRRERQLIGAEDAKYVVVGVVRPDAAPPAAHFRLAITAVEWGDHLRPGQTIDVRFLNDQPAVPPDGAQVRVWLLGQTEGLYLVCPGTQCEPARPAPGPAPADGFLSRPENRLLAAGAVAGAALIGVHVWRSMHRRRRGDPPAMR